MIFVRHEKVARPELVNQGGLRRSAKAEIDTAGAEVNLLKNIRG